MKHILDRYPDRFGWRGWLIAPQEMGLGGRLIAPFTGTVPERAGDGNALPAWQYRANAALFLWGALFALPGPDVRDGEVFPVSCSDFRCRAG